MSKLRLSVRLLACPLNPSCSHSCSLAQGCVKGERRWEDGLVPCMCDCEGVGGLSVEAWLLSLVRKEGTGREGGRYFLGEELPSFLFLPLLGMEGG